MQTNTYQAIIVTNTTQSYYIFSFTCGNIQWSGLGFETAIFGYNSHGDYFSNHPANGFADIGEIVSCTRQIIPARRRKKRQNAMVDGALANLIPANPQVRMNVARCNGIADFDDVNIPDIENIVLLDGRMEDPLSQVPHCPPTRAQIDISTLFESFPEKPGDCFRSRNVYEPEGQDLQRLYVFVSVCCYDSNR